MERSSDSFPRHAVVVALLILTFLASGIQIAWAAKSCVMLSRTGNHPAHVLEARVEMAKSVVSHPGGYETLAEQTRRNRIDLREGRISLEEAAARGGTVVSGNRTIPILPILYANSGDAPINTDALDARLFADWDSLSMRSYFKEVSHDQLFLDGEVYGFERMPDEDVDYEEGNNGLQGGAARLVEHAIPEFDGYVDFGLYDNDGPDGIPNSGDDDGEVDICVVIHPEGGAECGDGVSDDNIWSHHSYLTSKGLSVYTTNDSRSGGGSITINRFFVTSARECGTGDMAQIGVFCHEFVHALGIPDLYDTDTNSSNPSDPINSDGVGFWGLMGAGGWNSSNSPAHLCAFVKERLGWLDYYDVPSDGNLCLPPVKSLPTAARVWADGNVGSEYFLVENRQAAGFDQNLMGAGLVIYHIDESVYNEKAGSNSVNADERRKAIDVECADAMSRLHTLDADDLDIGGDGNRGDPGDRWCPSTSTTFDGSSIPDTRSYAGGQTGVAIRNIDSCTGDASGNICADYTVGVASPLDLCIEDCEGDNCNPIATCEAWWATPDIWVDNDEDGFHDLPAPGLDNKMWFRLWNMGPDDATNVDVSMHLAPGAGGLEWPVDSEYTIGTRVVPFIAAGEIVEDYFEFPYPDLLDLIGHWCVGVVIDHPFDPATVESASLSNNIAQINKQVLVSRAGGAGPSQNGEDCPGPFVKETKIYLLDGYNSTKRTKMVEVRLGTPPGFNDAVIPGHWDIDFLPRSGPFWINPVEKDSVTVRLWSDSASHGDWAYAPVTLWDMEFNEPIGGVILEARIDCIRPGAPSVASVDWRPFPGDDDRGHNVEVEWAGVTLDMEGNSEVVEHYEVFRADGSGDPELLVGKVAIDARPEKVFFQWFDTIPIVDCPTTFTYRIRAVDLAGNVGLFSDPVDLECGTTEVEEDGVPVMAAVTVTPNPFEQFTEIRFALSEASEVEVDVFDASGKRVWSRPRQQARAGSHVVSWDGFDDRGSLVPSGIYFVRVDRWVGQERRSVVRKVAAAR